MKPARHALGLFVVLAALSASPHRAYAHPSGPSFRLGLGLPAVSVTHFPEPDTTAVTWGLYPLTFGAHLGVQVTSEIGLAVHVLGGGRYDVGPTGEDTHFVYFSAAPRFEYMFNPHETIGAYLGAEVGIDASGDTDRDLRDVFRTGGFFGIHIFALTEFSVDLELAGNFLYDIDTDQAGIRGVFYVSTTGWLD